MMFQRLRRPYSAVLLLLLSVAERVLLGYTISPNCGQGMVAEQVQFDQSTFGPTLSFKEYRKFSTVRIKSSSKGNSANSHICGKLCQDGRC